MTASIGFQGLSPYSVTRALVVRRPLVAGWFAAVAVCAVMAVCPPVSAAEPVKQQFDLPSDTVEKSLTQLAKQSGVDVLLPAILGRNVRTNSVKGVFTPREALDRMLAGTGLAAAEDTKTGALTVRKEASGPKKERGRTLSQSLDAPAAQVADSTGSIEGRVSNRATGVFLEKARIRVEGTTLETLTDAAGFYRLINVPAGEVRLAVFYTGYAVQNVSATVAPGERAPVDINMGPRSAIADGTVRMAEFVVSTSKEMDGAAIAINEQRFAPNMVTVVSADEYGTIAEGSAGEFLKFMPGITVNFQNGDANSVSMSGAPSDYVPISVGGFSLASANVVQLTSDTAGRTVLLDQTSMNNVARVEVAFTPTPETSGAALAGSINLVPRTAFERTRPLLQFSTYLTVRDNERDFEKAPVPFGKFGYKIRPGMNFSYIAPVNKRLGFTFSGGTTSNFVSEHFVGNVWRGINAPTNGVSFPDTTPDNPYMTQLNLYDTMRINTRSSIGTTVDLKLSSSDRLSFSFQYAIYDAKIHGNRFLASITSVPPGGGTLGSPRGNFGFGDVAVQSTALQSEGVTYMPTLTYRHDGLVWHLEAGAAVSHATGNARNGPDTGHFFTVRGQRTGVTLSFQDMFYLRPRLIAVTDTATGAPIDPYALQGFLLNTASNNSKASVDLKRSAFVSIRRQFSGRLPWTVKAGLDVREQMRDNRGEQGGTTFVGADGLPATPDDDISAVFDDVASQRIPPFGFPRIGWLSTSKTWALNQANPAYFQPNEVAQYNNRVARSKHAEELVSTVYVRGDAEFVNRRLKLVGGLRAEQTNVKGEGRLLDPRLNFQRDSNGKVLTGPTGAPLLIAPAGSLQAVQLTTIDRGMRAEKEYLRWFPSLNAGYNVRENLIARAGYYWSVGRPNFAQYAGSLTLPNIENAPSPNNRIAVNNAAIKAWSARTLRVGLEYYLKGVGLLSVGAFRRDFENFFGATVLPATSEFLALYGLAPEVYGAYEVSTEHNVPGTVRMTGVDFHYKQALTFLPHWARGVQIFANGSGLRATGDRSSNFAGYVPRSGSWGIGINREQYNLRINWNYRGRNRLQAVTGRGIEAGTFRWAAKRLYIDVTGEYHLRKKFALFVNLRNIGDASDDFKVYGPTTPAEFRFSSREAYGSLWSLGLKGVY